MANQATDANPPGASFVYRTVLAIDAWPKKSWINRVSVPSFARAYPVACDIRRNEQRRIIPAPVPETTVCWTIKIASRELPKISDVDPGSETGFSGPRHAPTRPVRTFASMRISGARSPDSKALGQVARLFAAPPCYDRSMKVGR